MAARTIEKVKLTYYPYENLCGSNPCGQSTTCCKLSKETHYAAMNVGAMGDTVSIGYKGKSTTVKILDRGGGVPPGFERWADISPAAWRDLTNAAPGVLEGATMQIGGGSMSNGKTDTKSGGGLGGGLGAAATKSTRSGSFPCPGDISALIDGRLERVASIGQVQREEIDEGYLSNLKQRVTGTVGTGPIPIGLNRIWPQYRNVQTWEKELWETYVSIGHTLIEDCGQTTTMAWSLTNQSVIAAFNTGTYTDNPNVAVGEGISETLDALKQFATALWFVLNPANWAKVGLYILGTLFVVLAIVLLYLFSKKG